MPNRYTAAHENAQGAGDSRPTGLEIIRDEQMEGKLSDKTILITGCSSGIGIETARAFAATGAKLFLTVRDLKKGREVLSEILKPGRIELLEMDQNSLESVRHAAKKFLSKSPNSLNMLVCNAGIMACPESNTRDGFESQFGVNHLSHFLLFQLLKSALLASSSPSFPSRVIVVASSGHRRGEVRFDHDYTFRQGQYDSFAAYGQSKTANIYMANEIERRWGPARGLTALSLHPGGIATNLQQHMPAEWLQNVQSHPDTQKYSKSPAQGCATTVYAALSADCHAGPGRKGGRYLEDCDESVPADQITGPGKMGYMPWIYDVDKAKRLWRASCKMVGLEEEEEEE